MAEHAEYLRRNLMHAKSVGLRAESSKTLTHLRSLKRRVPLWLLQSLEEMKSRAEPLPHELAQWRNRAPDRPYVGEAAPSPKEPKL